MYKAYLLLVTLALSLPAFSQVKNVWALGDGEKVFRNDNNHPEKKGNLVWDGEKIRLKGLYNEVLAFQVITETDLKGAEGIEVSVDAPVERKSGKVIGGSTLKYGPSGTIELFSEHYLHVTDSTSPNWFYGSKASAPKKMTGWIPDALIPSYALKGRGGFPLNVAPVSERDVHFRGKAFQNQGFWVDVHLPRDQKNFPAGIYYGKVTVWQKGSIVKEIPLEVTLLPFYMPEENRTNVWLYTDGLENYYPDMKPRDLDRMVKFEAHRHRIDLEGGFSVNFTRFNKDSMELYRPYLDGSAFTPANGYQGPGSGFGETYFPIGMYGSPAFVHNKQDVQEQSNLWVDWFSKNAPRVKYFWYIIDEPRPTLFPWIKERTEWINSNPGPGKSLPVFTTSEYKEELAGHIDYFAANDGVDVKIMNDLRKNGGDYWFYNGNRPRYGSVILEGDAVDFRVTPWILYKYDVNVWFIWHGTHWQHNQQGPKGRLHQNVFTNPLSFINESMEFGNGDGIVFYPGHMPYYPDQERGLNELIPTIRLKNLRRGQQDAIIMAMAEKKAGREKVISIISRIVPKALSEVSMKEPVPWSEKGSDYDKAREELLKLL